MSIIGIDGPPPSEIASGVRFPGLPRFPVSPSQLPLGGRLKDYAQNWQVVLEDPWVLDTLTTGLQWRFHSRPLLTKLTNVMAAPVPIGASSHSVIGKGNAFNEYHSSSKRPTIARLLQQVHGAGSDDHQQTHPH